MKAKLIILTAFAALLASCAKEKVETSGETGGGIGFTTHLTRGTGIDNAAGVAAAGGFDVWAYAHTGGWSAATDKAILIDNTGSGYGRATSADAGATWDYGTPKMWPIGRKVSSFAYAPHGKATVTGTDAYVPVIRYEVPTAAAGQVDLMIAAPVIDATAATAAGEVPEVFHHALSRISFQAFKAAGMAGNDVVIKRVVLENIQYKGYAKLETSPAVSWTLDPALSDFEVSVADGSLKNMLLGTTPDDILSAGGTMFMMPQTLGISASMIVEFSVDDVELIWEGPIPAPSTWLPGRAYNYKLGINADMVMVICGSLEAPGTGSDWGTY